jgi:hypothetical protein
MKNNNRRQTVIEMECQLKQCSFALADAMDDIGTLIMFHDIPSCMDSEIRRTLAKLTRVNFTLSGLSRDAETLRK